MGTVTSIVAALGDPAEVLKPYESDYHNILDFLLSMFHNKARKAYKSRVKYVVVKLREMSPAFSEKLAKRSAEMPWDDVADVAREVAEELAAQAAAEEKEREAQAAAEEKAREEAEAAARAEEEASRREIEEAEAAAAAEARRLAAKPDVMWVDYKAQAFANLEADEEINFKGFHDDQEAADYQPPAEWIKYFIERSSDPDGLGVDVIIVNKAHTDTVRNIQTYCRVKKLIHPLFIVVTRAKASEFSEDLGISQSSITKDWGQAAKMAKEEVTKRSLQRAITGSATER